MIRQPFKHTRRIIIEPGEYYVSNTQEVISTLLGSCVAACLYDPVNNVIGMNHFLLAYERPSFNHSLIEYDGGRYGIHAMELLINDMIAKGANKENLKAKCFGGGDVLNLHGDLVGRRSVGGANIDFIRKFLKEEKIPITGSSLGGKNGRNVHFIGEDFSVYVKQVEQKRALFVQQTERTYRQKTITEHEQLATKSQITNQNFVKAIGISALVKYN
ncbi:MAG: chemotaxis protein CheD [Paraglaciecola sp.]|jgi:chemotaxis protein CheD